MQNTMTMQMAAERIAHIESHLNGGFDVLQAVHNIENNTGDPLGCLRSLSRHAQASAMSAWFTHRDIKSMRQWCYVGSRLDQERYKQTHETHNPGFKIMQLIKPLLSNHDGIIHWFAHFDLAYDLTRVEDHKTIDFWAYQALVALRGDWSRLIKRCEKIIDAPPKSKILQKYQVDHYFYLALAQRDIRKMQEVLDKLVAPTLLYMRNSDENGYTENLISSIAVFYAKLAWFHDCHVLIDTPYIPLDWLIMEPLSDYNSHYSFLN